MSVSAWKEKYDSDPEFRKEEIKRKCKDNNRRWKENKTKAIEYTGGLQCHGKNCLHIKHNVPLELYQIDFHHVVSENKTKPFSLLFRMNTWKKCKKEIDNCKAIPLCKLCHAEEEHHVRGSAY
jgi:hypothetical protein